MSAAKNKKPPPTKINHLQGTGSPFVNDGSEAVTSPDPSAVQPAAVATPTKRKRKAKTATTETKGATTEGKGATTEGTSVQGAADVIPTKRKGRKKALPEETTESVPSESIANEGTGESAGEGAGTATRSGKSRVSRAMQRDPNSKQCVYLINKGTDKERRCETLTASEHGYCGTHAGTAKIKKFLQGEAAPEKPAVTVGPVPDKRAMAVFPQEMGDVVRINGKPGILLGGGRWVLRIRDDQTVEAVGKLQNNKYLPLTVADEKELKTEGIIHFGEFPEVLK